MPGFFDWLSGRSPAGPSNNHPPALKRADAPAAPAAGDLYAELSARLGDYPPDTPPHRGDPHALTPQQRADNLAHFTAHDAGRIATLVSWLARQGLDGVSVLVGDEDALAEGKRIGEWLANWVPQRPIDMVAGDREPNAPLARWFASDRAGPDLVFSFVSDLARLNAASIRSADPLFAWAVVEGALDRAISIDPVGNPAGESSSERHHLCLVKDLADGTVPVVLDVPLAVLGLVHQSMSPLGVLVADQFPIWLRAVRTNAFDRR